MRRIVIVGVCALFSLGFYACKTVGAGSGLASVSFGELEGCEQGQCNFVELSFVEDGTKHINSTGRKAINEGVEQEFKVGTKYYFTLSYFPDNNGSSASYKNNASFEKTFDAPGDQELTIPVDKQNSKIPGSSQLVAESKTVNAKVKGVINQASLPSAIAPGFSNIPSAQLLTGPANGGPGEYVVAIPAGSHADFTSAPNVTSNQCYDKKKDTEVKVVQDGDDTLKQKNISNPAAQTVSRTCTQACYTVPNGYDCACVSYYDYGTGTYSTYGGYIPGRPLYNVATFAGNTVRGVAAVGQVAVGGALRLVGGVGRCIFGGY